MEKKEFEKTSLINQIVNEDRERYMVYKTNKNNGNIIPQEERFYLLELLDDMGFDINRPGTYLFRELVKDIHSDVVSCSPSLGDYKSAIIFKDLNSEKSFVYTVLADRLGINTEGLTEYLYDAVENISEECSDKDLRSFILGYEFRNKKPSVLAYDVAKYFEKTSKMETKPQVKHGLVKEIKKKSESI